jgi:hypothetical protein
MKAKDWAAKIAEAGENRDEVLKAFVEEIGAVAKQRGGSASAVEGAVREQRAKWQAVCRACPAVSPEQFETLLAAHGQEYKKAEEAVKARAAQPGRHEEEGPGRGKGGRRPGSRGRPGGRGRPA